MLYLASICRAMLSFAVSGFALLVIFCAILCCAFLCFALLGFAMLCCAMICLAMLGGYAWLCLALFGFAVRCCVFLCSALTSRLAPLPLQDQLQKARTSHNMCSKFTPIGNFTKECPFQATLCGGPPRPGPKIREIHRIYASISP